MMKNNLRERERLLTRSGDDITEDDVQIDGEMSGLNAELAETDVSILEETNVQSLISGEFLHFLTPIEISDHP